MPETNGSPARAPEPASSARSVREGIEALHGELGKLELGSALTNAIEHLDALDHRVQALVEEHQRIREANAALAESVVFLRSEHERLSAALVERVDQLRAEHEKLTAALVERVDQLGSEHEVVLQANAGLAQAVTAADDRLDDLRFALDDTGREVAGVVQQAIAVTSAPAQKEKPDAAEEKPEAAKETPAKPAAKAKPDPAKEKPDPPAGGADKKPVAKAKPDTPADG